MNSPIAQYVGATQNKGSGGVNENVEFKNIDKT
jgi:hypothetical protein